MKQALILWGGWDGHDPRPGSEIVAAMLGEEGFGTRVEEGTRVLAEADLTTFDLIVPIITMSKIEKPELAALTAAVEAGTGLAGYHGGMGDSFRESPDYQVMTGGQWVAHPGDIIDYTVEVIRGDDPIMAGLPASFRYRSEQYYMHTDPSNEVLAVTRFSGAHAAWAEGVVMPVVWKRRHGKGRVFYSSLGHKATEFAVPEMATILRRGMLWAAR